MTNTVLCGSVSYKHTVKENEDNTELEISTAIHSDMNGTEKNFNFPMKEFVLNSAEVTIEACRLGFNPTIFPPTFIAFRFILIFFLIIFYILILVCH